MGEEFIATVKLITGEEIVSKVVYLEDEDSTYIWKTVENQPILIEYDCNFE